jgi:hypothetical protein
VTKAGNPKKARRARSKVRSKYINVSWDSWNKKWRATIRMGSKDKHLGRFLNEIDAGTASRAALHRCMHVIRARCAELRTHDHAASSPHGARTAPPPAARAYDAFVIEHHIDRAINFPNAPGAVGHKAAVRLNGRDAEAQRAKKRETSANINEAQKLLQRAVEARLAQAAAAKEAAERAAQELNARPSREEIAAVAAVKAAAVQAAASKAVEKARLKAEAKAFAKSEKARRREEAKTVARAKREKERAAALAARPPKKKKALKKKRKRNLVGNVLYATPGAVHHTDQNGISYDCDGNQLPPLCGEGVF